MAARRLVVVMLVLLAISTLAALLVPAPEPGREGTGQTSKPERRAARPAAKADRGELLRAGFDAGRGGPATVRIERGDQLALAVSAPFGDDIEIPALGLVETADRYAGARFDLFASRSGSFAVRAVGADRLLGTIVVGAPGSGRCGVFRPRALPGPAPARECGRHGARASQGDGRSAPRP